MRRRDLLAGAGLLAGGAALATAGRDLLPGGQHDDPTRGRTLAFQDDFTSADGIDLTGQGEQGRTWFTDQPYGWGRTPPGTLGVADGVLTIAGNGTKNYAIATMSPTTGAGRAFSHGYFEARLAFDPARGPLSDGFPAFWSVGARHFQHNDQPRSMEVDFFEAMHPSGRGRRSFNDTFAGTVHEWRLVRGEQDVANYGDNTVQLRGTDWSAWHDYGCEWVPGRLRWFLDGRVVLEQRYGPGVAPEPNASGLGAGTFAALEEDHTELVVILGTGAGNPLWVDRVRVWQ